MDFGETLRSVRDELGLTQPQLARLVYDASDGQIDLTAAEISRYERGRVLNPRLQVIRALAKATGKPIEIFTNGTQEAGPSGATFRDGVGDGSARGLDGPVAGEGRGARGGADAAASAVAGSADVSEDAA